MRSKRGGGGGGFIFEVLITQVNLFFCKKNVQ